MKTIDEIRRQNIKALEGFAGGPSKLADLVSMSYAQYVNLRDGARDSKTGKPRGMRRDTARKFELAMETGEGWLDQDHSNQKYPTESSGPPAVNEENKTHYLSLTPPPSANSMAAAIAKRIYALPEDLLAGIEPHLVTLEAIAKSRREKGNQD